MFKRFVKRTVQTVVVASIAVPALVVGQGHDIAKILGDARKALGADKSDVKTVSVTGRTQRSRPDGTSVEQAFEFYMELPDKFMKRDVVMAMGPTSIYRMSGFNGNQIINEMDTPPSLSTGGAVIRMVGPGGAGASGAPQTPEQRAEADARVLAANKADFQRLALGMFAHAPAAAPLVLSYGGEAESADGKAYVVNVQGEGTFAAKLFIDTKTNLPLMLSWMDKEPLQLTMGGGPGGGRPGGAGAGGVSGGGTSFSAMGGHTVVNGSGPLSQADRERMQKEMDDRLKEAEAKRRTVEYRLFYGDYKTFSGGVKLPTRIQRMIDGTPSDEMTFDRVQVNTKIDPKKFEPTKADKK